MTTVSNNSWYSEVVTTTCPTIGFYRKRKGCAVAETDRFPAHINPALRVWRNRIKLFPLYGHHVASHYSATAAGANWMMTSLGGLEFNKKSQTGLSSRATSSRQPGGGVFLPKMMVFLAECKIGLLRHLFIRTALWH